MTAKHLLVVDDESEFCDFVRQVAEEMGFSVAVCTDSAHALDAYDAIKPAVVVLDMVMPDVEGIQIVRELARRGTDARVILVSGYNPHYVDCAQTLGQASGIGRIEALTKPVRIERLRAALAHA
jgi:DNA-binding NtrC family response regulator